MGALGVVDIGSHKIKVAIFSIDESGLPEILSIGEEESKGVERGSIVKPSSAKKQIKRAVKMAEDGAATPAETYYILISHPGLKSSNEKVFLDFKGELVEIDSKHLEELRRQVEETASEPQYKIIHIIPRYYILDGEKHYEPEDLVASKIEAEYHVIKLPLTVVKNSERLLMGIKLIPGDNLFGAYTASLAIFDEDDLENNILLIDLGHTTSSYIYFKDGAPLYSGVVNVGGKDLTEEIAQAFHIPYSEAEKVKHEYAVALRDLVNEDEEIVAKDKEGNEIIIKRIELAMLTEQIMSEVFGYILEELYRKGINLESEIDEIVLIGGGAHLEGIKDFVKSLGFPVRLGVAKNISSVHDKAMDPQFAQVVGVAAYLAQQKELPGGESLPFGTAIEELFSSKEDEIEDMGEDDKSKGFFGRIFAKFKSIFLGD